MEIYAQAPCRVDLAGGTIDIWPLYLYHPQAVTVNFAVTLRTSCRVSSNGGTGVTLRSIDQKIEERFDSMAALEKARHYRHPLAACVVRHFRPAQGVTVVTDSESPAGAGISGSSSMLISTVSAFNRLLKTGYTLEEVREVAQNIEAQIVKVPTGCQDYYPAMYGGVNAIGLKVEGIRREALPVNIDELNSRFVLAYTGKPRNSGINNWEVMKAHIDGERGVWKNFSQIAAIADAMRGSLERSDWRETARLLRAEWKHRKGNSPGITTPLIDRLVEVTRKAGARAAKVCGAGGGGCVVFLCEPDARTRVEAAIEAEGARILRVEVARRGVAPRAVQGE
jgi:D-glycero-alpha-D-manno-heptose-7-phosphate kinase